MAWRRKADGRPYADIFIDGVRKRPSLLLPGERGISDSEAERRYRALVRAARHGPREETPETIADILQWYCDTIMPARGNRDTTIAQNRVIFARCIEYFYSMGVTTPEELAKRPGVLDAFAVWRLESAKPSTVNKEIVKLRAALRAAQARGIISAIPAHYPRLKTPDPAHTEPLTPEDFRRFLKHLREHTRFGRSSIYNVVRFLAHTGCRPCDAVALRWRDIHGLDTPEPVAQVRQQKTGRYVAIALSPPAVEAIREERAREIGGPRVFTGRRGEPLSAQTVQAGIVWHAKRLGLRITAKTFRQSIVSTLYDMGADDALVKKITGHKSDSIRAYRQLRKGAAHALAAAYAAAMEAAEKQG